MYCYRKYQPSIVRIVLTVFDRLSTNTQQSVTVSPDAGTLSYLCMEINKRNGPLKICSLFQCVEKPYQVIQHNYIGVEGMMYP